MAEERNGSGPRPRVPTELGTGPGALALKAPAPSVATAPDDRAPDAGVALEPPPPEEDSLLGTTLEGLYRIERRIGQGGMGTVYEARHVHLGKRFAIKVLSAGALASRNSVERLRTEAIAASSIDHEGIVDVVNFDTTADGLVFIVMEYLEGESLADLLARGRLPAREAVPLVADVCAALEAAHARGIVHRDLKPENIFLLQKGGRLVPKVLDFGISKIKSDQAEQVRVTTTGQLVGTPLYMAPEQAKGENTIDHRADVYALGAILYELVTGTPPFEGSNYFQLLWKHGNEVPTKPSERAPDAGLSPALDALVMKCLAKQPAERFGSMAELHGALAALADGGDVGSAHAPPRRGAPWRGGARVWIGAAAVVLLAVLGARWWSPAKPAGGEAPHAEQSRPGARDTAGPATERKPPEPAQAPSPPVATPERRTVRIETDPRGATLFVNGERVPSPSPAAVELPLDATQVEVRAEHKGHVTVTRTMALPADPTAPLRLVLRRAPSGGDRPTTPPIRTQY